ncbi:hypothetical protein PVAP13_2NG314706 [Panicum virgatum]|uniref:Uncharacterized protein n=1 Tax=Panicum virgatum TaxID=38727 RepID=A0A8T0VK60_PANVG|nr:hypothetical protein PVAP13_2NG314706 [Panicum virgatum]
MASTQGGSPDLAKGTRRRGALGDGSKSRNSSSPVKFARATVKSAPLLVESILIRPLGLDTSFPASGSKGTSAGPGHRVLQPRRVEERGPYGAGTDGQGVVVEDERRVGSWALSG